ncbi:MAG: hypothetical protein IPM56_11440 [Ignavibacteriales bacterium]|nr:MAG: hypothetical protein IPM56_11440 [Ignavibacteriales bacterium]
MENSDTALNKKYLTLFWDSIKLIETASEATQFVKGSLIRASIVSTILSIECAANICISSLNLPLEVYNEVERMDVIGKYNFYLYSIKKNLIDKSRNEYSILKNLIRIRNNYAHPKVERGIFENGALLAQFGNDKNEIPFDIRIWNEELAVKILNNSVVFLNYYFKDLCNYSRGQSQTLLASFEQSRNVNDLTTLLVESDLYKLYEKYLNIKPDYLSILPYKT